MSLNEVRNLIYELERGIEEIRKNINSLETKLKKIDSILDFKIHQMKEEERVRGWKRIEDRRIKD